MSKKRTLGSCVSDFSSWFWGEVIWKKVRIPDSVLLVHSEIATISGDNSALNKNGFMKMLSPLPRIKTLPHDVGDPTSESNVFQTHSVSM